MPERALVVWYSLSGNTRRIGQEIASALDAPGEELIELHPRTGGLRMFRILLDAVRRTGTAIRRPSHDPANFDLVVLGTPVWAGRITPAIRTYARTHAVGARRVAFFLTQGGQNPGTCFEELAALCGKAPVATLTVDARHLSPGAHREPMDSFLGRLGLPGHAV